MVTALVLLVAAHVAIVVGLRVQDRRDARRYEVPMSGGLLRKVRWSWAVAYAVLAGFWCGATVVLFLAERGVMSW
jgi:hypothetical protein